MRQPRSKVGMCFHFCILLWTYKRANMRPHVSHNDFFSAPPGNVPGDLDVLCFCHLRWDFVFQRPQHLLSRFSKQNRVFFFEEPIFDAAQPSLELTRREHRLVIATPHLPGGMSHEEIEGAQRRLLDEMMAKENIANYMVWCYSPMSLGFWDHLSPTACVYDCMDELSLFKNPPPQLAERERALMERAEVMFTGGQTLYESKRSQHDNVYPFPSSIDGEHFRAARKNPPDPED